MDNWLTPQLSLSVELQQEKDRRAVPQLQRDDLEVITDRLITDWYRHQALVASCLKRIASLEVELTLAQHQQPIRPPQPSHQQMARDLLRRLRGG